MLLISELCWSAIPLYKEKTGLFPASWLLEPVPGLDPLRFRDNRTRIALGAARGLVYLHVSGKVVHGNIKSSNIILRQENRDACVSDYGLNPLFSNSTPRTTVY